MSLQIYINGEYFDKENAKISVYDHGLLYGDGIFEGMRAYSGHVFEMEQHIERLYDSAKAIHLTIPISAEQMIADVNATLQKNSLTDAYVRLIVTRGGTTLGLDPYKGCTPTIIIIADKITLYPDELYENGLEIITASTVQTNPAALNPRVKSLNYLKNIMAKIEGLQAGCQEAMMLNQAGNVAECTGDNIFTIKKNVIRTPSVESGILEGITRNAVIKLARKKGYEVHEVTMNRHDVYVADECFLTGSAAEVIPVIKVDSRPIGDGKVGPITKELIADFRKFVVQPPA